MGSRSLDTILEKLPFGISSVLKAVRASFEASITELSLRADRPVCIYSGCKKMFITQSGFLTESPFSDSLTATQKDIEETVLGLCDYSVYAYQDEINSGFITLSSGVRVGLCGRAVIGKDKIVNIRDISSLNFRVPRDVKGCSRELLELIDPLRGVLICGEPSSGKTTLIRDMSRTVSYEHRVSLIDERMELSAYCRGEFGFDIGLCDVFAGYPKNEAVISAIRSMSPEVIVCDEIGGESDAAVIAYSLRCGAAFIASLHASDIDDLRSRPVIRKILSTGAFGYIVFLSGREAAGKIKKIYEMRH